MDYEMSIYDRWGNRIFFTDDISKPWTGAANRGNEIAQMDVYVYVVKQRRSTELTITTRKTIKKGP